MIDAKTWETADCFRDMFDILRSRMRWQKARRKMILLTIEALSQAEEVRASANLTQCLNTLADIVDGAKDPSVINSLLQKATDAENVFTSVEYALKLGTLNYPAKFAGVLSCFRWMERDFGKHRHIGKCKLMRDIFGNPFRTVAFDPSWQTSATVLLAQSMYDSRDFTAMPVLADALEEAGCRQEEILGHCRGESATHVRGCWVVDLVLGKS